MNSWRESPKVNETINLQRKRNKPFSFLLYWVQFQSSLIYDKHEMQTSDEFLMDDTSLPTMKMTSNKFCVFINDYVFINTDP